MDDLTIIIVDYNLQIGNTSLMEIPSPNTWLMDVFDHKTIFKQTNKIPPNK